MNELLSIFFTWQFLLLSVGISAITFVIRTGIEYFILDNPKMPGNSKSNFWRNFVLVILPIGLGFVFAKIGVSFPYPDAIHDPYSKFLFSSSAGLLSPTLYRVIKAMLWNSASQTNINTNNYDPTAQPTVVVPSPIPTVNPTNPIAVPPSPINNSNVNISIGDHLDPNKKS